MPVEDHEVHDKVRIQSDTPYGCHSRESFVNGYYAPDRVYRPNGTYYQTLTFIEHATSRECRSFYLWDVDPRCKGCTAAKDVDYQLRMTSL